MLVIVSAKIAGNGKGLAMAGDFITSSPEPKPIEKLKLKIITKSQITNCQAGTKADSGLQPKLTTSSPAIAKPHVELNLW